MDWLDRIQPGAAPPRRPHVCIVSDVRGWAFDVYAHGLATALADDFAFSHVYVADWLAQSRIDWAPFDLIYEQFHRNPAMGIPMDRCVGALRSEWFKPETPRPPDADDLALVGRYRAFQVAVQHNYTALRTQGCSNVYYLTNPVDSNAFATPRRARPLVASWSGNAGHAPAKGRNVKHFWDIVIPACAQAGIPLVAAEYGTATGSMRRRAPSEMPAFYQQGTVALCASEYEAASYSVMEAMASGQALIATDVGNHREMRASQIAHYGDSGILLVERTVPAFVDALRALTPERIQHMGEINRVEIAARWSWHAWAERYRTFLRAGLKPV